MHGSGARGGRNWHGPPLPSTQPNDPRRGPGQSDRDTRARASGLAAAHASPTGCWKAADPRVSTSRVPATNDLPFQLDWDAQLLRDDWEVTPDIAFALARFAARTEGATADGTRGPVGALAAGDGPPACSLRTRGLGVVVLEPSTSMLARARNRQDAAGVHVPLVRAVAEASPFRDGAFDRVLCDSALDHLADPERALAQMARIAAPDGRVILSFSNYGGLTVRASRLLYRLARRLRVIPDEEVQRQCWDTPVPHEHTFECTIENVTAMCRPYLELEHAEGVSLGFGFPGWGRLLARHPTLRRVLPWLDGIAARYPALADLVVTVWRPKPRAVWPRPDELHVRPTIAVYRHQVRDAIRFWNRVDTDEFLKPAVDATRRFYNERLTGNAELGWLEDLVGRASRGASAAFGADADLVTRWFAAGGGSPLDIYDFNPDAFGRLRRQLGDLAARTRFVVADLNFVELPERAYDVVWAGDCLPCVTNLEHLFTQVARALRPGGLVAFSGYVGESRMQWDARRLACVNAVLATVPAAWRRIDVIEVQDPARTPAFSGIRALEILPLARARFEVLHEALTNRLAPLDAAIDWRAAGAEGPRLLALLRDAEAAAADDPVMRPCLAYVVFRQRSAGTAT